MSAKLDTTRTENAAFWQESMESMIPEPKENKRWLRVNSHLSTYAKVEGNIRCTHLVSH